MPKPLKPGFLNPKLAHRALDKGAFLRLKNDGESFIGVYLGYEPYEPPVEELDPNSESYNPFARSQEAYKFSVLGLDGVWRTKEFRTGGRLHRYDAMVKSKPPWPKCGLSDFFACIPDEPTIKDMVGPNAHGVMIRVTRHGEAKDTSTDYGVEVVGVPDGLPPLVFAFLGARGDPENPEFTALIPVTENLTPQALESAFLKQAAKGCPQTDEEEAAQKAAAAAE